MQGRAEERVPAVVLPSGVPELHLTTGPVPDPRRLSVSSAEPESSDDESTSEGENGDHAARELERQRVLEAAGLIVKQAPPRPPRKRRPAPKAPLGRRGGSNEPRQDAGVSRDKDLPDRPHSPAESILRIDDAYERYQAFRESRDGRMSLALFQGGRGTGLGVSIPAAPPSPSATVSSIPSATDQTKAAIKSFFGRGPERERERERPRVISAPVISAPISSGGAVERGNSPAFGMVSDGYRGLLLLMIGKSWSSLVDKSVVEGLPDTERKRQEVGYMPCVCVMVADRVQAIFELIATESAYVRDLQMIVEVGGLGVGGLCSCLGRNSMRPWCRCSTKSRRR